jgi:hypothetical protein
MAWDKDGKSKSMLMNGAQIKKLVASDKLMKGGYGSEGLDLASTVHKDLDSIVKGYNEGTKDQTTIANTVARNIDVGRHERATEGETARHNKASEGISAAHLSIAKEKAAADKKGDFVAGKLADDERSILMVNKKDGTTKTVSIPEGFTGKDYFKVLTGEKPTGEIKQAGEGYIKDNKLYMPNPDPKSPVRYVETPLGPSALDQAIEAKLKKGGAAATPATPAAAAGPPRTAIPPKPGTPPPVDASTPTEQAGLRVDAARAALAQLRPTAPGLAKGGAARETYAIQLQQAQQELAEAEMLYQQTLPSVARPAYAR